MKVQLNRYSDARGLAAYGMPYDLSVPGQEEAMALATAHVVIGAKDSDIWFYTVENWTGDLWATDDIIVNSEYSVCYTCDRDISRINAEDSWRHVHGDVTLSHIPQPKKPKKPTIIPNNEMEKLFIKYFHHLKAMGVDPQLEYHHHFNTPVEFTDEEWAKLQELDVDAIIQED